LTTSNFILHREQETEDREQETEDREQETEDREQETEDREQETEVFCRSSLGLLLSSQPDA
jgi:hypothetical protein